MLEMNVLWTNVVLQSIKRQMLLMTIYGCYGIEGGFKLKNDTYVRFSLMNIILCQTSFNYDLMWNFSYDGHL